MLYYLGDETWCSTGRYSILGSCLLVFSIVGTVIRFGILIMIFWEHPCGELSQFLIFIPSINSKKGFMRISVEAMVPQKVAAWYYGGQQQWIHHSTTHPGLSIVALKAMKQHSKYDIKWVTTIEHNSNLYIFLMAWVLNGYCSNCPRSHPVRDLIWEIWLVKEAISSFTDKCLSGTTSCRLIPITILSRFSWHNVTSSSADADVRIPRWQTPAKLNELQLLSAQFRGSAWNFKSTLDIVG